MLDIHEMGIERAFNSIKRSSCVALIIKEKIVPVEISKSISRK